MKLRNKKTGKIIDLDYWNPYSLGNEIGFENDVNEEYHYNSLSELFAEWEDYKPTEPLIKDEKIDYFEIKRLVKDAMREAEEERVERLAQYYATLCGEEE